MITRLRRLRPSPAMVVACLALLVALAGTSVAAVQVVVPRNSVGALALKPNSVNSSKVLNHSLLKTDFKAGQLPAGPRGLPGPAGPDGSGRPRRPGRSGRSFRGRHTRVRRRGADGERHEGRPDQLDLVHGDRRGEAQRDRPEQRDGQAARLLQRRDCVLRQSSEHTAWSGSPSTTTRSPRCRTRTRRSTAVTSASTVDSQAQHAIVRVSPTLSAGAHTVRVEIATTSASTKFRYDDWTLAAQRIRVT